MLGGLSLRASGAVVIAVTGAPAPITVDGAPADNGIAIELEAGQLLKLAAPKTGLRSYLAVGGGFDVEPVLGSRSSDTLSGVGPAPLKRGDRLPVGRPVAENPCVPAISQQPAPAR